MFARRLSALASAVFMISAMVGTAVPAAAKTLPIVKPVMSCSALAETDVSPPGQAPARIVTARVIRTGVVGPYCEVRGYVTPQVNFELRLPTENWMQRLMFSGCGGFCGRVEFRVRAAEGCAAVDNGEFAMVTSDLGHNTPDGNGDAIWAAANPQAQADYGYRGVHVVTVAAKAIVERYYGRPQAYAYFNGCSDGGREGLMEVQRYPTDFNGVVAGAPVINDTTTNSIFHAWITQHLVRRDGTQVFKPEELALLHRAALDACDLTGDGFKDGVIGDPIACRFDPGVIQCSADAAAKACLTAEQVADARAVYSGPLDPSGRPLFFGRPVGSEMAWRQDVSAYPRSFITYLSNTSVQPYDLWSVGYDGPTVARYNAQASVYNALDPDIRAFQKSGGKLIMWHGWADPAVPPMSSVEYYKAMRRAVGPGADGFSRLYMLPGVGHCGGGDGPDKLNLVDPIVAWVEDGVAPEAIEVASKSFGRTLATRPVWSFPAVAKYKGAGDGNAAASFAPAQP